MAKIWYSCTKIEHKIAHGDTLMAGVVFHVKKLPGDLVSVQQIHGKQKCYTFTVDLCRKILTRPTVDFDSVMEESFLQSEATYC
jgi:hypothetical protein